jgi:Secretion system C-terminal sorting domain
MKERMIYWIKTFTLLVLLFSFSKAKAGVGDFEISIQNITQSATNKLEFDVYLLDTDTDNDFYLSTIQFGFLINSDIYTGGTLSVAIDNTGSGLGVFQYFYNTPQLATDAGFPDQTLIKFAGELSQVPLAKCTLISKVSTGTLLTHFIITNTIDFTANSTPDFIFTSSTDVAPLYATFPSKSDGSSVTELPVSPGANAIVNGNPILNPSPTAYNLTGGGSSCQGTGGLPVGLSDSEGGVTYTLYKNTVAQVPTVSGTGSAITFGNQLAGTYTVSGNNAGGTTTMTGEVVILEILTPDAPTLGLITQPTCDIETGSVTLTGLPIGNWTNNPGNLEGSTTSTTISDLSASTYNFIVTASGCNSAPTGDVVINVQPGTPPKPEITPVDDYLESSSIPGNQWYNSSGMISGATEQIYIPSENGNFYVIVTNTDGCASEASDVMSFTTGVEMIGLLDGISIYPNPAKDYLTIENNSVLNSIGFEIINSNGKIIYNSILKNISIIDISRFSSGLYYIRLTTGSSNYMLKFIKQ